MMNVVVFFSGGASAFRSMLDDPSHGKLYQVVAGVTNVGDAKGRKLFEDENIEVLHYPLNFKSFDVEAAKPLYDEVLNGLRRFNPDIIALSGFMRLVTYPLIEHGDMAGEYSSRVFNVHPADLAILSGQRNERFYAGNLNSREVRILAGDNELRRKYKGEDAVYDAVQSGEKYTKSTVHIATEDFDEGPILVQSKPFLVKDKVSRWIEQRNFRPVRKYADELQERMKWEGDGPAFCRALEMAALGELSLYGNEVYRSGIPLTYNGVQL